MLLRDSTDSSNPNRTSFAGDVAWPQETPFYIYLSNFWNSQKVDKIVTYRTLVISIVTLMLLEGQCY